MTIHEALAEGNAALSAVGIENPALDTSLLIAEVLNTNRSAIIANANQPIEDEPLATFNDLIMRRMAGECVAYIIGKKEFYGLEFLVNPSVLVPRPETELLVELALEKIAMSKEPTFQVLDLCTGSGAIAIALKHEIPELEAWATDISSEALEVAKTNATRLLPPGSTINFYQGDLFGALSLHNAHCSSLITHCSLLNAQCSFSLVVSNPPYIPTAQIPGLSPEVRTEPILALDGGSDGLDLIRTIISQSPEFLIPGGTLLLEADPCQMETITTLLQKAGFMEIQVYKDLSGLKRVIKAKK